MFPLSCWRLLQDFRTFSKICRGVGICLGIWLTSGAAISLFAREACRGQAVSDVCELAAAAAAEVREPFTGAC